MSSKSVFALLAVAVCICALEARAIPLSQYQLATTAPASKTLTGESVAQGVNPNPRVTAFINVNVVPMNRQRMLGHQTVIIRGERIEKIGPAATTRLPKGALRIDGRGKYLMPGLIDMHIHAFTDDRTLLLYIANGVTSVRNMAGHPRLLALRQKIASGEIVGPNLYTCGAFLLGYKDPVVVKRIITEQSQAGYDCLKIYNIFDWSKEAYEAAIESAITQKIPAVGHLPYNLPLEVTLKMGRQTVEHTEQFFNAYFVKLKDRFDESKIPYVVRLTKEAGITVDATLAVYHSIGLMAGESSYQELIDKPELGYIPPTVRNQWMSPNNRYKKEFKPAAVPYLLTSLTFLKKLTKAFHEAGVGIVLGSDAAEDQPFMLPGFSIHDELQELVSAGFSPFEAIQAGTSNAARLLSPSEEFGSVAAGKRADLILVERNPLEDVANIKRRVGVMLRGRWMAEEELKGRLAELRAAYAGT